jgi:hypothetical protein
MLKINFNGEIEAKGYFLHSCRIESPSHPNSVLHLFACITRSYVICSSENLAGSVNGNLEKSYPHREKRVALSCTQYRLDAHAFTRTIASQITIDSVKFDLPGLHQDAFGLAVSADASSE